MQRVMWTPGMTLEAVERQIIEAAFQFYGGNKTATASSLGVSVRTLFEKLERIEADNSAAAERRAGETAKREEWTKRQRGILPPVGMEDPAPPVVALEPAPEPRLVSVDAAEYHGESPAEPEDDLEALIGGAPEPAGARVGLSKPSPMAMPPTPPQRAHAGGKQARR